MIAPDKSAVPAALLQVLPKWFLDRPATTEALWAAAVSGAYTAATVLSVLYGAASADGTAATPGAFAHYVAGHWFGAAIGVVFPALRGRQAYAKASAPLSPQPPP